MSRTRPPTGAGGPEVAVVLAITPNGTISARAAGPRFPVEGDELFGPRGHPVGTVTRVFGPVARPYLAIRPRRPLPAPEAAQLIGATVSRR